MPSRRTTLIPIMIKTAGRLRRGDDGHDPLGVSTHGQGVEQRVAHSGNGKRRPALEIAGVSVARRRFR